MKRIDELPEAQRAIIVAARQIAQNYGAVAFLVGGPVRDLELGLPAKDVDLALESHAENVARDLARHLEATLRTFPQFLTYKIVSDELPEVDVTTTRAEEYSEPGALPAVTPSSLVRDLERRDFGINAIALDLSTGAVVDPLGGLEDLRLRRVRVLHDRSFIDDPTRILRAIRFGVRLGFEIEPRTLESMRAAVASGALDSVSRERLWREILLAIDEDTAAATLVAMGREGILERFVGSRGELSLERMQTLDGASRVGDETDRVVVLLAAILEGTGDPLAALHGASLSLRRRKHAIEIIARAAAVRERLHRSDSETDRLAVARDSSDELLIYAAADLPWFAGWFDRLLDFRRLQLPFTGADLGVAPGAHVGVALDRTREAIFLGEVSPGDALVFARATAMKYLEEQLNRT